MLKVTRGAESLPLLWRMQRFTTMGSVGRGRTPGVKLTGWLSEITVSLSQSSAI